MPLPSFELHRPKTIKEAMALLQDKKPSVKILAGGTDLLPSLKNGLFAPKHIVSLLDIASLRVVKQGASETTFGSMVPLNVLIEDQRLKKGWPAVGAAAIEVGTPLLQTMATLGGNLLLDTRCLFYNQSSQWRQALGHCLKKDGDLCHVAPKSSVCLAVFSSDLAGPLMFYGAKVQAIGPLGTRVFPLQELYKPGDGGDWLTLKGGEILEAILLPQMPSGWRVSFQKFRVRGSLDFALGAVTLGIEMDDGGKVVDAKAILTSLGTHGIEVPGFKNVLVGSPDDKAVDCAATLAARASQPLGTHQVEPGYRRRLVRVHVRRMLDALLAGGGNG